MTSTSRTALCGPACRVVWQGSINNVDRPYADSVKFLHLAVNHALFHAAKAFGQRSCNKPLQ